MNIRVDLNYALKDGTEVVFRSPVDCSKVRGLKVYYTENGVSASKEFVFADAHGNNVGDIPHLFAENVVVKVILDVTSGMAFVQNADTNAYLEFRFEQLEKAIESGGSSENGATFIPAVSPEGVISWSNDKGLPNPEPVNIGGKTAYEYARDGGYTGTESEFTAKLAEEYPTKVSQLQNDSGYITGYTETDPTVPAWAKTTSKPSYTKNEVGLGNVDNVKQYSVNNPPPYPVTSVNGKAGAVSLDSYAVGARPSTWTPTYTDVGADKSGAAASAVSTHNTNTDAHNDIRLDINAINERLNAFF